MRIADVCGLRLLLLIIAASLLARLGDYQLTVPVRVDRHGAVFKPSTSTRLSRSVMETDRRSRRSPHVRTTTSPSVDEDDDLDASAASRSTCVLPTQVYHGYNALPQ